MPQESALQAQRLLAAWSSGDEDRLRFELQRTSQLLRSVVPDEAELERLDLLEAVGGEMQRCLERGRWNAQDSGSVRVAWSLARHLERG